jgi:hypothetical protein
MTGKTARIAKQGPVNGSFFRIYGVASTIFSKDTGTPPRTADPRSVDWSFESAMYI